MVSHTDQMNRTQFLRRPCVDSVLSTPIQPVLRPLLFRLARSASANFLILRHSFLFGLPAIAALSTRESPNVSLVTQIFSNALNHDRGSPSRNRTRVILLTSGHANEIATIAQRTVSGEPRRTTQASSSAVHGGKAKELNRAFFRNFRPSRAIASSKSSLRVEHSEKR